MKQELICIECPKGCPMGVDIENGKLLSVSGNKCPKGKEYAQSEIEDPRRILTSSVLCEGLDIRMLPVRTDQPIPKAQLMAAMEEIKKTRVRRAVKAGDKVGEILGVNIISTRNADALAISMRQ
jgi:CxxC motif-containing protein